MFTGIIETIGIITGVSKQGSNINFLIKSPITAELKVDQSLAHNGVCLTVTETNGNEYGVTAVAETIDKTNAASWKIGDRLNLERSLRVGDRLDGHFVQGHIDAVATCVSEEVLEGSRVFRFSYPDQYASLIIEKGSICLNGVSLTVFDVTRTEFSVTIIPYTYEHTNFSDIHQGGTVNVEFDVLGKYLMRQQTLL
jgi:riboflavin synthase